MLRHWHSVRAIAREIADAAEGGMNAYRQGHVSQEPQITDRILGGIQDRIENRPFRGILWSARTLRTGPGVAAEEKRHGADFLGVLDIELPEIEVKKGFLAQAKRAEPGDPLSAAEWDRLQGQCRKMLEISPASFVVVYSRRVGIRFVPAVSVAGCTSREILVHYDRGVRSFFEAFIECFTGDHRLDSPNITTLDALRDAIVPRVLVLKARQAMQ